MPMPDLKSRSLIEKLISFDTTSRNPNLDLINFVVSYLEDLGVSPMLVHNEERTKANLYATLGPQDMPGIMLSGHTDVVPVDGQAWDSDPWQVIEQDGKLFGRGTCDMKGFIAICLAYTPIFLERGLNTPIHLAFSYDEEIGCIGVQTLIEKMKHMPIKPAMCIVGEPTSMDVSLGHKGKRSYDITVRGLECHSSLAPFGVNAVEFGADLINYMTGMAKRFADEGPFDEAYDVTYTTVHTGVISGGTALNIVPKECIIRCEFRNLAEHDPDSIIAEIETYARETLEPRMHAVDPNTGIDVVEVTDAPGLNTAADAEVVTFVKSLAGRNNHIKVAFATEAGLFTERVGIPTVICGPGSIEQAHKPNEYCSLEQLELCEQFMDRLVDSVCGES
jgi:acetylornithine deacetylase